MIKSIYLHPENSIFEIEKYNTEEGEYYVLSFEDSETDVNIFLFPNQLKTIYELIKKQLDKK